MFLKDVYISFSMLNSVKLNTKIDNKRNTLTYNRIVTLGGQI